MWCRIFILHIFFILLQIIGSLIFYQSSSYLLEGRSFLKRSIPTVLNKFCQRLRGLVRKGGTKSSYNPLGDIKKIDFTIFIRIFFFQNFAKDNGETENCFFYRMRKEETEKGGK